MFANTYLPFVQVSVHTYYYRKIGFDIDSFSFVDFQKKYIISKPLPAGISAVVTNLFDGLWVVISFF
jgi:hypothetical protein